MAPHRHRICPQNRPLFGTILAPLWWCREKWLLFAKRSSFPKRLLRGTFLAPVFFSELVLVCKVNFCNLSKTLSVCLQLLKDPCDLLQPYQGTLICVCH